MIPSGLMILKPAGGMFLPFMNSIQKCVLVFVTANLGLQIIQVPLTITLQQLVMTPYCLQLMKVSLMLVDMIP